MQLYFLCQHDFNFIIVHGKFPREIRIRSKEVKQSWRSVVQHIVQNGLLIQHGL